MPPITSETTATEDQRIRLSPERIAPFLKTRDQHGDLSNMAAGFRVRAGGMIFSGSEALYQSLKYPAWPVMQQILARQNNGMAAKRKTREPDMPPPREDWDSVKKAAMIVALATKLAQHPARFGRALLATQDKLIVEVSYKDRFWGAEPQRDGSYAGCNVLGRMLTQLRQELEKTDGDGKQAARNFVDYLPDRIRNEELTLNRRHPWRKTEHGA